MPASLSEVRRDSDDDISNACIKRAAVIEETLRGTGVQPSELPTRPNSDRLTHAARLEASAKYCESFATLATKHSALCAKLADELCDAIVRVVKAPLPNLNNETIHGLSEAESKKALALAVRTMFYQAKQIHILAGEGSAGDHLIDLFNRQRKMWLQHAEKVEQELQQRSADAEQISALEEDVAKRSAEVCELRSVMKVLSKKLHNATTGTAKFPKGKSAMESPVERIISAVQEQREALKELKAKLREADAKNQELQLNTKQLYENMEELQRQLVEASAEKAEKESEIEELMEKRIRCSVCMDREKDTVFVCGHAYCNLCASEWRKCTVCVTQKGNRPITFRHPLFL